MYDHTMRFILRLRTAVSERKIRCRNCRVILEDWSERFCSNDCSRDYSSVDEADWQAHA